MACLPLSVEQKRGIFNQFGEEGLKRGAGGGSGGGAYNFTSDPREIFSQFFGPGVNPFEGMFGGDFGGGGGGFSFGGPRGGSNGFMDFSSMTGGGAGGPFGPSHQQGQDPPVEHTLKLNLEELYHGCTRKMKISRKVLSADGTMSKEDKIVSVDVKPGWKPGTKVTFPREGDQVVGKVPSDIVFVIDEKPHEQFKREGNNLRHRANISLKTALCGGQVDVPRIDGHPVRHPLLGVVGPDSEDVIPGQGMPISKQPGKRGDLLVSYNIKFPRTISESDKIYLANILDRY